MSPAASKMLGNRAIPLVGAAILLLSVHANAARTLMFLVDYWTNGPMDTIIGLNVYQPPEVVYLGAGALPVPQASNAYVNPTYENFAYWYSLSNFNANDYSMGRIRIDDLYQRGWYQNDSTYTMAHDTVIDLSKLHILDTATTFTYRNPVNQRDTTIAIPAAGPKTVALPAGAWFKGPKLYTSSGNGGTPLLNQRPTTGTGMGSIDNCLDTIPNDTVWIRFSPAGQQQPSEAQMSCTSYNPFSKLRARLYLRNPWPGSSPVVDWNGEQLQMYPSTTRPDWMVVDLRYFDTSATKPAINFRFQKSTTSGEFFDASGVNTGIVQPFQEPGTTDGLSYYFVPPEGGGTVLAVAGVPPLKPPYMLYVQDPWSPGTPRVIWPNDSYLRVMRPTQNCGWYSYPLYNRPVQMLIGHSYLDSIYGSAGVQFRTRSNWVTLSASIRPDSSFWVQTFGPVPGVRVPAVATTAPITKSCATDTLNLVMEAYDFRGRGDVGGNPSFQIGGWTDLTGAASTGPDPGMVETTLGANGLPVYTGRDSGYQTGGINGPKGNNTAALTLATNLWKKSTPSNWFDTTALQAAVPGISIGHTCLELPLIKTPTDSGYYKYDNQSFFPLDTINDKRGVSLALAADNKQHNFSFCLQGHAAFEYTPGLQFEFRGDDDVWVFINNHLAIDLGGTHAPESTFVNVDKLHLVEGRVYPFDIFYCERQTNGSSIRIRTSMDLQPSWKFKDSLLPNPGTGKTSFLIQGQMTQNYTPTCADLAAAARATWQPATGQMVVVGPDGSDLYTIYSSDTTLYGGALIYSNSTVTVDTAALKLNPDLAWTGKYTILVQSLYGDPLDSISFTKSYGSHVVQGTVFDANGDGIADSIRLVAPAPIFLDNPSYHVVWFDASGKKDSLIVPVAQVNVISDSIVDVPLGGRTTPWGIRTALPPVKPDSLGGVLTHPGGMTASVDNPIKLLDGIAPVADSAWLSYDTTGTGMDTLYVVPSEPVQPASVLPAASVAAWILDGNSTAPNLLPGVGIVSTDGLLIKLPLAPATDPIVPGDSIRLGGKLSDLAGNAPGTNSRWVPVLANAVAKAWMLDTTGMGAPDVIHIASRGSLAAATSATVHWKTASGADTSFSINTPTGLGGSLALPSGILQNATYCSGCRIDVFTGTQSRSFALLDSVAPVAVSASYFYGTTMDTLVVVASEALTKGMAANENWVAQKSAGSASTSGTLVTSGTPLGNRTDSLIFVVPTGTFTGDSLRLRAWSLDASGNVPGQSSGGVSKFVPVVFSAQPVSVTVYDENGDGRADSVVFSLTKSASGAPVPTGFTVQWGGQTISIPTLTAAANGLSWSGPIGPFAPNVTAPLPGEMGVIHVGTDSTTWRARVVDSVAPVATKASYRYGLTMDTLTVTASEQLVQGNATGEGWVAQKNAPSQSTLGAVATGTALGTPTNVLTLLVAPGAFTGDSLRLRAWSKDAVGNAPGAISPWVPVSYGPQPIRVQLFDENGDGRADSVVFRLARSANGVPVPDSFTVQWNGQTLSVKNLVRSADQLSWSGPIGPFALGTAPASGDAGWFDIGSDQTSYRAPVEDSVAPVARTGSLVFGFDPGSPDTLIVTGSEGLVLHGSNSVLLNSDSSNTGAYLPTGARVDSSGGMGKVLKLLVTSGSIPNDAAWVRFGTSISDNGGATVGASSLWVKLVTRPSGRAYLFDSDGDGRADSVAVLVRGTLPAATAVLTWTNAAGKSDTRTWPVGATSASFGVHPTTPSLWFEKGATSCPTNACTISFLDSTGATLVTWPLVDSVAPMALSGTYSFGATQDTLTVKFSEPLKQVSQLSSWVEWGNAAISGAVIHFKATLTSGNTVAVLVLDTANGATQGWDSVRIATGSLAGKITDALGVSAGAKSPWAPLTYGLPPMIARVTDPLGKGQGTNVQVRLTRSVPKAAISGISSFQIVWNGETRTVAASSLSYDTASQTWSGSVGTAFALGNTSAGTVYGATVSGAGGTTRGIGLEDGVPPAIMVAQFRYSTAAVGEDTLIVQLSEPWPGAAQGNNSDPFVDVKNSANPLAFAPMIDWKLSSDGKTLSMVVDTTWATQLSEGDSARLAYLASGSRIWDAAGNHVGAQSRWVPIVFGLRPIEFTIRQIHSMLVDKGDVWTEPGPNVPQTELLVQNTSNNWVKVDNSTQVGAGGTVIGGAPAQNDSNHVMAVYLKLNRPVSGELYVYDNIGVSVLHTDLSDLRSLWPAGDEDAMHEVEITWNGTDAKRKFVATGIYLMRVVVKVDDGVGHVYYKNLIWKFGWQHGAN